MLEEPNRSSTVVQAASAIGLFIIGMSIAAGLLALAIVGTF